MSDACELMMRELVHGSRTRSELAGSIGAEADEAIDALFREGLLVEDNGSICPSAFIQNINRIHRDIDNPDDRADSLESYLSWSGMRRDVSGLPFDVDAVHVLMALAYMGRECAPWCDIKEICDQLGMSLENMPRCLEDSGAIRIDEDTISLTERGRMLFDRTRSLIVAMFDDRASLVERRM